MKPDTKCKECGKTIFSSVSSHCFYCLNKEKIENQDFKPGKSKKVELWKQWYGK